jgi:hypothetical protein
VSLALWSPPSSRLESLLPSLEASLGAPVVHVSEAPSSRPRVDLDLYDVADDPAHTFAYRAAREVPGVVLLRDAALVRLLAEEVRRPESRREALGEMERAHGEDGPFVARLVARGMGGDFLPAFFPLQDSLFETSLGVMALTEGTRSRAARRMGDDRTLRLPLHLLDSPDPSSPGESRRSLSIPEAAPVLAAARPDPSRLPMLSRVVSRLRAEFPDLLLLVGSKAPVPDAVCVPDLRTMAAAADVVVALDPVTPGGVPAGLAEAMAARRPLIVNAGSSAVADFREGSIAAIDPGLFEEAHLEGVCRLLLRRPDLREALGRLAADEARRIADPTLVARSLATFLAGLVSRKESILADQRDARTREKALLHLLTEEVEVTARSLGLPDLDLGLAPLFQTLVRDPR